MISIIIPCYNHGRFLSEAVDSILKQTEQNFEIIVVNDASTDGFNFDEIQKLDKRVRLVHLQNNTGTARANNAGIRASKGDYITMMSADDMREPESFKLLLDVCKKNPHNFAYDDMRLVINGTKNGKVWKFPEYDFDKLLEKNTIHAGIMFERKAFDDTGGYPEEFAHGREDWAFNLLLGTKGYCGIHVNYAGYLYRRGDNNRTKTNTTPEWENKFAAMIRSRFAEIYSGRFPMGCCGNRRSVRALASNAPTMLSSQKLLVGAEGMTLVEYTGGNYGTTTFYGPSSGTRYRFDAGDNKKKLVSNNDLHTDNGKGLLDLRVHTKPIFRVTTPDVKPEPVVASTVHVTEYEEKPLTEVISASSSVYKKLSAVGITTVEQVKVMSEEELISKAGISKSASKAIYGAINA